MGEAHARRLSEIRTRGAPQVIAFPWGHHHPSEREVDATSRNSQKTGNLSAGEAGKAQGGHRHRYGATRPDLGVQDPFYQEAVAYLPTGLQYVRRANIWTVVPIPTTLLVILTVPVPGQQTYWVIQQTLYAPGTTASTPFVIPFNVTMPSAKSGDFSAANERAFTPSVAQKIKGKMGLIVDIVTTPAECDNLKLSCQISVSRNATKGRIAKAVVGELEKLLAPSKNVLVALFNHQLVREVSFEDLFLVDLVQVSQSSYQPIIALRT